MKPLNVAFALSCCTLKALQVKAGPTWPSSYDEIEDLMLLNDGYRARGFADPVVPCSFEPSPGHVAAAAILRTVFHDVATANAASGTGGMDGSIAFELAPPYTDRNRGGVFNFTLSLVTPFHNSRASMADLLALSTYTSVRSCGGPVIPIRAGRVDATEAAPIGVPDVKSTKETFIQNFARMGFTQVEMIQMTACGHTLGGVHASTFPNIVPVDSTATGVVNFDSTSKQFDNRVVTSYVDGTTQDPLVVGPDSTARADLVVFSSDNNATVKAMTDLATFQNICRTVLQRMIEVVPTTVKLTDIIIPYDVKPSLLSLSVNSATNTTNFAGEIRVRTNNIPESSIAKVQLVYKDRTGGSSCGDCLIDTTVAGKASGFDDAFTFYSFSHAVASDTSISAFYVIITLTSGQTQTFDNNGNRFPVHDDIAVQFPHSNLSPGVAANGTQRLSITAAVRNPFNTTIVNVVLKVTSVIPAVFNALPTLQTVSLDMTAVAPGSLSSNLYTFYQGFYDIPTGLVNNTKFDVVATMANGAVATDAFHGTSEVQSTSSSVSKTIDDADGSGVIFKKASPRSVSEQGTTVLEFRSPISTAEGEAKPEPETIYKRISIPSSKMRRVNRLSVKPEWFRRVGA